MPKQTKVRKTTYLLAWSAEHEGIPSAFFEESTQRMCTAQGVVKAGVQRGDLRVVAFCDHIHGDDYLTKDELRLVAACWLDDNYDTIEIDLRK